MGCGYNTVKADGDTVFEDMELMHVTTQLWLELIRKQHHSTAG